MINSFSKKNPGWDSNLGPLNYAFRLSPKPAEQVSSIFCMRQTGCSCPWLFLFDLKLVQSETKILKKLSKFLSKYGWHSCSNQIASVLQGDKYKMIIQIQWVGCPEVMWRSVVLRKTSNVQVLVGTPFYLHFK